MIALAATAVMMMIMMSVVMVMKMTMMPTVVVMMTVVAVVSLPSVIFPAYVAAFVNNAIDRGEICGANSLNTDKGEM